MTVTATELLLEATDIAKTYGAVVALQSASLAVRPGEVNWMTAGKAPPAAPAKCDIAGLNKSAQLGGKLRINGTPAIFFESGERVGGYIPAAEIEKRFSAAGS